METRKNKLKAFNVMLPLMVLKKLKSFSDRTGLRIRRIVADALMTYFDRNSGCIYEVYDRLYNHA